MSQKDPNCHCENEAKVLYDMYKKMGTLKDGTWQTKTCCADGMSTLTIAGKSVTLVYPDGTIASYTES